MKRFHFMIAVLLLGICVLFPMSALAEEENPVPAAKQAVVQVAAGIYFDENGNVRAYNDTWGTGTAFGVGETGSYADTFVTNCHVVSDENDHVYDFVYVCIDGADIYDESTLVKCRILYTDSDIDVAVIQAEEPVAGVTTLPLLPAETLETGDRVYSLGFPGIADVVADSNNSTVEDITVTDGIISRYLTYNGVKCMAHTATINHGNSGGPLIDENGAVIGINTFGHSEEADLRSYAIYIDYAMEALDQLGLPYTLYDAADHDKVDSDKADSEKTDGKDTAVTSVWLILLAVLVLIAVAAAAAILILKKRKPAKSREGNAETKTDIYVYAINGPLQGERWQLKGSLRIGRDPAGEIVYPASTQGISRMHCRIDLQQGTVVLTDLGATYGTYVDGRKLNPNETVTLRKNAVVSLGSEKVQLTLR